MNSIPFNKPCFAGNEQKYIAETIANLHISGDGPFTKACHRFLEEQLHVRKALLTTSCTHALEMTSLLLKLQPGDEVILPSFTFVSSANAYVLAGAKPVFVDIRPDTLNIDEQLIEAAITPKTRAIVVVHYAGVAAEMDAILEIGKRHNVPVIEDNAHGLFAAYRGRMLGTLGVLATQSFHETKNFTCGEGGALLINDERYVETAEIVREKGTDRSRFFRGQVDKYTWVSPGSSYLPSDVLAAFLYAQFEAKDRIQATRERIWKTYAGALEPWAGSARITLPYVPPHCDQAYHMFYLLMPSLEERTRLITHLRADDINAVFHYVPLHRSQMAARLGAAGAYCPVTDSVSDRLVRLPFYNDITESEQLRVTEAIQTFAASRVA
ncbi:MAG: dTDP-4-amino-4,6-dideoxygalactose transaminase [Candidatus Eremiobacteraeota bacterium]|nr:dTDP-4-amino-4,6-dideoxygalactose transaminase [Candidatus Eremiobacteraeota bacterium]